MLCGALEIQDSPWLYQVSTVITTVVN